MTHNMFTHILLIVLVLSSYSLPTKAFCIGSSKSTQIRSIPFTPKQHPSSLVSNHAPFTIRNNKRQIKLSSTQDDGVSESVVDLKQRAQVLLYRSTLIFASLGYSTEQIFQLLLGTGLSAETTSSVESNSHAIAVWGILLSALLAPPDLDNVDSKDEQKENRNASLPLFINKVLPPSALFAILFEIIHAIQHRVSLDADSFIATSPESLNIASIILICALCLREIGYFGAAFKAEAILAIFFGIALELNSAFSFGVSDAVLAGGLALSLLVLSVGKVFEPILDDLNSLSSYLQVRLPSSFSIIVIKRLH